LSEYYSKIRKYASGILLLSLAGFIISAVNYVISTIPDTIVTPEPDKYSAPVLVSTPSRSCYSGNPNVDVFRVNLTSPPRYKKYMIVFMDGTIGVFYPRYFARLDIFVGSTRYSNVTVVRNATHYFAEWSMNITSIDLYYYSMAICWPHRLYIYLVDFHMPVPPPPEVWNSTTTSPPIISSKEILSFTSWIASIFIVIIALHKFDIYV
jgi:hypothetical protein